MKKTKKTKTRTVYVKVLGVENGRPTCEYFRVTGKKRVAVTSREYYDSVPGDRVTARRGQKVKSKNGHGETPGAGHCWPLKCEALAVHPDQVQEFNDRNKAHGVNVTYDPKTGIAIVPDAAAYKRLRRVSGFHFNNAYDD